MWISTRGAQRTLLLLVFALLSCRGQGPIFDGRSAIPSTDQTNAADTNGSIARATVVSTSYLYVAGSTSIERFPIVNGVLKNIAQLRYNGTYSHIALDPLHYLYASQGMKVSVFAPGSTIEARTLTVKPFGYGCIAQSPVQSILVDSLRRLYAGFTDRCEFVTSSGGGFYYTGRIYVYAAGASGTPVPVKILSLKSASFCFCRQTAVSGLALDSEGELLVSDLAGLNGVFSFAPNSTTPRASILSSDPAGLAVDSSNELYVDNPHGSVSVYVRSSTGAWSLNRMITIAGAASFGTGIATAANRLFIPNPVTGAVYDVSSIAAGQQRPLTTLVVTGAQDVKVDP